MFSKHADETLEEISPLDKKVNSDNLLCRYKGPSAGVKFDEFDNALNVLDKIKEGKINLAKANIDQTEIESNLGEIKKGSKKHRSKEQKDTLYNIEMLYKARHNVIKSFDDLFFDGI